ncbi:MAG: hypothetical protein ACR2GY_13545 [Phycisphaerales bacterium]
MSQRDVRARSRQRKQSRIRRWVLVLLLLACGASWLIWAIRSEPLWWQPPDAEDVHVVDLGHGTEQFVIDQMHQPRDEDDTWQFRLHNDQMNAWLRVNLPAWFVHTTGKHWPDQISLPLVSADAEGLHVGVRVNDFLGNQILSARLHADIQEDGVHVSMDRARIGRAPVPAISMILDLVRERFSDQLNDAALQAITRVLLEGQPLDATLELADGRCVQLLDVELEEDAIVFTARTVREAAPATDQPLNEDAAGDPDSQNE